MHRTLIVARMEASSAKAVAEILAELDASELPRSLGVSRRTLFRFHELYFNLSESEVDINAGLAEARKHPLHGSINARLSEHIRPYGEPWRAPKDAMAEPFYVWEASPSDSGAQQPAAKDGTV